MGVYLSSPVTDKVSEDKQCDIFTYGASSMQGWRMTQEDSHNCIPDFDTETKTSLFAVYDGHGGSEVAKYCAANLPDFIKGVEQYNNNLSTCLQDAFLGFDETLTHEDVIKELKVLAGDDDGDDEDETDAIAVRKEADILFEEATMPIEELRAKYSGNPLLQQNKHLKGQKQPSPMIRAKRSKQMTGNGDTESVKEQLDLKEENEHPDNDNNLNTEKELNETKSSPNGSEQQDCKSVKSDVNDNKCESAVSSSSEPSIEEAKTVNHSDSNEVSNDTVSTSSKDNDTLSMESSSTSSPGSSGTSGISSEAASSSSSGAGDAPSSTSSVGTSQQGSSNLEADSEPSGSGEPGSSGVSGSKKKSGLTFADLDSDDDDDDDSSDEDEAYNSEDYEDVDDDDDDDEDDDGPGLFRYVKDSDDDQPDEEPGSGSGCTAVVALLRDKELVVANAGDSRCVLCRDGKAIDLSVDHKPEDKPEKDRIEAAGGQVTEDGRVNGGLNLSRALGDHYYKKNISIDAKDQMISAYPDIECASLEEKDEFMVLACDGIWNYMSSQEVVDYVRERLKDEKKCNKPSLICEEMFDHCLAPNTSGDGTGCDNMTCIIVVFKHNNPSNNKKHDLDTSGLSEPPEKRQRTDEEVPS